MGTVLNNSHLNEQQLDMLRLLHKPLPEEYFKQLKHLAVQLLGRQLDDVVERWEQEKNITEEDYDKMSHAHHRTQHKK